MRPIASRIAAAAEHSGSLHAIGYAYEPRGLTLCESAPVANCTFPQHRRSNIRVQAQSPNILRGMAKTRGVLAEAPLRINLKGPGLTARGDQSPNLLAMVGVRTILRVL